MIPKNTDKQGGSLRLDAAPCSDSSMPVADITYEGTADYLSGKLRTEENYVVAARKQRDEATSKLAAIHDKATRALQTFLIYSGKDHVEKLMREIAAISSTND